MTNRETIKFRVWNKKYKRWLSADDGGTHASSNWAFDIFTGKIVDYVNCDGEYILSSEPDHYFDGLTHIKESPLVLQQYTGLKDTNSVEIYEGDIVWLDYTGSRVDEKDHNQFEIIFYHGAFQLNPIKLSKPQGFGVGGGNFAFSHIAEIIGHNHDDEPVYQYHLPPPQPISQFNICVVMGNIFENPELLEA